MKYWHTAIKTLLLTMAASYCFSGAVSAEEASTDTFQLTDRCDFEPMECVESFEISEEEAAISAQSETELLPEYESTEETEYWKQFCTDYYYAQLPEAEQTAWDRLESACLNVVLGEEDYDTYFTVDWSGLGISSEESYNLISYFKFSNPQFYFLRNKWIKWATSSEVVKVGLCIYDAFQDGSTRAAETASFKEQLDEWLEAVSGGERDEDKEKIAHDLIMEGTLYVTGGTYSQSAYSLVCEGETVCAGYAATMQLLLNPFGVQTIEITSSTHAWNAVYLYGEWYLVDATWDDQNDDGGQTIYTFYNKSEQMDSAHQQDDMWDEMAPEQCYDSTSGTGDTYLSPYFTQDNYLYFMVNDNTDKGSRLAKPIERIDSGLLEAVPANVQNNFETYQVVQIPAEKLTLSENSATMAPEEQLMLAINVEPEIYTDEVIWESTDEKVVSVSDDGMVTAQNSGSAEISVTVGVCTASCSITVKESSPEDPLEAFVERIYDKVLEQESKEEELTYWATQLRENKKDAARVCADIILGSDEFKSKERTNEEYLQILYATFFGREADEGGLQYWLGKMASGTSQTEVLANFVNSDEFNDICNEYGITQGIMNSDGSTVNVGAVQFVERCYTQILGRSSEREGLVYWAMAIANGDRTASDVPKDFLNTDEYKSRSLDSSEFLTILYQTFMNREADEDGISYWKGRMNAGMTETEVIDNFQGSDEFQEILAEYGL